MNVFSLYRVWDILKNLCILCILWFQTKEDRRRNSKICPSQRRFLASGVRRGKSAERRLESPKKWQIYC